MPNPNKRFKELINRGIRAVFAKQYGKSMEGIELEISEKTEYAQSTVQYWRQGHIPPNPETIEILVRYIVRYGDLDRPWAKSFLEQADYPDPNRILGEIFPTEDGDPTIDEDGLSEPRNEFNKNVLKGLDPPGGVVKLSDKFYVERVADVELKEAIVHWGSTTTIQAPRQMGKTSLLVRGLFHAEKSGAKVVYIDFQGLGHDQLMSVEIFVCELARWICQELRLDKADLEEVWKKSLGPQNNLTYFIEDYILPEFDVPVILAMDEADYLLQAPFYKDFFSLMRSWHNRRANHEDWDKLNIVLIISTEPYLLIDDINQSPFNVGLKLELEDFTEHQVQHLNRQHGQPVSENEISQFMKLLGGHPYLTRKALYVLTKTPLSWDDLTRVAATKNGPLSDHLRRLERKLNDQPELKEALIQVTRSDKCPDETLKFRLLRAGLVKTRGDKCICRCELYRQYFRNNF